MFFFLGIGLARASESVVRAPKSRVGACVYSTKNHYKRIYVEFKEFIKTLSRGLAGGVHLVLWIRPLQLVSAAGRRRSSPQATAGKGFSDGNDGRFPDSGARIVGSGAKPGEKQAFHI